MTEDKRAPYVTRDALLKLLSDDEVASVSMAETTTRLEVGEEYLDLAQLDKGVRWSRDQTVHMGRVLAKKSVHPTTWNKILAQLSAPLAPTPASK